MGSGNMGGSSGMMGSGGMMGASGTTNNAAGGTLVQPWLDLAGVFLIILGSALVMVWAFRQVVNPNHQNNEQPPLLLLQRRYARGEIGAEDFNRMRADLLQDRSTV